MSQASDLIAEVKQLLTDAEKEIKTFERDVKELGHFTDLAHLRIAAVHLRELLSSVKARRAQPLQPPQPAQPAQPEPSAVEVDAEPESASAAPAKSARAAKSKS